MEKQTVFLHLLSPWWQTSSRTKLCFKSAHVAAGHSSLEQIISQATFGSDNRRCRSQLEPLRWRMGVVTRFIRPHQSPASCDAFRICQGSQLRTRWSRPDLSARILINILSLNCLICFTFYLFLAESSFWWKGRVPVTVRVFSQNPGSGGSRWCQPRRGGSATHNFILHGFV